MVALYFVIIGGLFYRLFIVQPNQKDSPKEQEHNLITRKKAAKLHA